MSRIQSLFRYAFLLAAVASLLFACKEDPDNEPTGVGQVSIEFENVVNGEPLRLNEGTYTNANGDSFNVTMFRYFISNITLTSADGTEYVQPESYYLVNEEEAASRKFTIPNVPTGEYTGITFTIGVDSARNVSGAQTGALDPNSGMFWTWKSGYIYVRMEGYSPQAKTSADGTPGGLVFHIGGFQSPNNCIRTVSPAMEGNTFEVKTTGSPELHFVADVARMFDGPNRVSFAETSLMHGGPKAIPIADNYTDMFTLDHIHE